jgi:hypothetical protein
MRDEHSPEEIAHLLGIGDRRVHHHFAHLRERLRHNEHAEMAEVGRAIPAMREPLEWCMGHAPRRCEH